MPFEAADPNYEAKVRESFLRQPFMAFLGAELVFVKPGLCEIQLAYHQGLTQQHGFFHGGVVGTLADNSCGYAAYSLMAVDASVLTAEYKLNLMSPADGELLLVRGEVIKPGRTLTVCQAEVFVVKNGRTKTCATALATIMTLPGRADRANATAND